MRRLLALILVAALTLTLQATSTLRLGSGQAFAAPLGNSKDAPGIVVPDGKQVMVFSLKDALEFLKKDYIGPRSVGDPLAYAKDMFIRGQILAYYLRHSAELSQAGFFEVADRRTAACVRECLNARLVSDDLAGELTPRDVLALHAVVYATMAPQVFERFCESTLPATAHDATYNRDLERYCRLACQRLAEVEKLSGLGTLDTHEIREAPKPHSCDKTACKRDGTCPNCDGSCKTGGTRKGECMGTCKSGVDTGKQDGCGGCSGGCKGASPVTSGQPAKANVTCQAACKPGQKTCPSTCPGAK